MICLGSKVYQRARKISLKVDEVNSAPQRNSNVEEALAAAIFFLLYLPIETARSVFNTN